MPASILDLAARLATRAQHAFDTLAACREEARLAREAAAQAELPRRSQPALRAAYALDKARATAPSARAALAALERRAQASAGRRLAPFGTAAVAVCALLIVVIVLTAPPAS